MRPRASLVSSLRGAEAAKAGVPFDRQSVLGIEYTLSERLKLEVETGISQSVDLNYTIEKD